MDCSIPGFPVHHQLLELCSNSYPLSRWCHATISSSVVPFPALNLSQHQNLFHWVGSLHQVAKVLKLSFSPSNKYSGLISFRMDWLDLLAVQESLKSLLQDHSLKASVLQHSVFFMVQLSHPYMTTGKTIALSTGTFVGKRMSPFFNTQSRFGALGKCKAFSERSFQGKLPGGLLLDSGSGEHGQILRWRAWENPQSPGLVTFIYPGLREPETSP